MDEKSLTASIDFNPIIISTRIWTNILQIEGKLIPNVREKETTIYLFQTRNDPLEVEVPVHQWVHFRNNSMNSILNLSILYKKTREEVLTLKELPAQKTIGLEFRKEGFFEVIYLFANSQKFLRQFIKVIPGDQESKRPSPNFHPKLKPFW